MVLPTKYQHQLRQIFSSLHLPVEIWAYGSRVNGSAHQGSDLDLVIRSYDLTQLPANVLSDINERLRESNIPILIELRDWALLPSSFHNRIEKNHEVLFSNLEHVLNEPREKYSSKKKKDQLP